MTMRTAEKIEKRSTPSSMMIVGRSVTAFSETASDRLKRNSPRTVQVLPTP
ncbi:hypothetical protein [Mesorhizobium sp. M0910]|uniref:hypothetical protein n=1 Tax=Mesorhizobium sp. M0910 TaxID=2957025 RepID=UPI00333A40BD